MLERLGDPALRPNVFQLKAMAAGAGARLHYVWGPPGTGKTACLPQIARMFHQAGKRILILAHANAAVDAAMLKVAAAFRDVPDLKEGKILRVGPAHLAAASQLSGKDEEVALRMTNVALSRARGKVIVLADASFIDGYHSPRSPARKVLALVRRHGLVVSAREFLRPHFSTTTTGQPFTWFENWDIARVSLLQDLERFAGECVINFVPDFLPGEHLVERLSGSPNVRTIFAPLDIARRFESADIDVRTMSCLPFFLTLFRSACVYIGSREATGAIVRLEHGELSEIFEQLLLGSRLDLPAPSSRSEREFKLICGTCGECGEQRRPRALNGGNWFLQCSSADHSPAGLSLEEIQSILHVANVRCALCTRPARAVSASGAVAVSCPEAKSGCPGKTPQLEAILAWLPGNL